MATADGVATEAPRPATFLQFLGVFTFVYFLPFFFFLTLGLLLLSYYCHYYSAAITLLL